MKKSKMVMKFDPYGVLMISWGNCILIVFHLNCYIKHKWSTILMTSVANLSRFVTLTFCFKTLFKVFCEFYLYIIIIYDWINIIVRSLSAKYGPDRFRRDKSVKLGTELPYHLTY